MTEKTDMRDMFKNCEISKLPTLDEQKISDNEIIKALKNCVDLNERECDRCPYECRTGCIDEMIEDALDLINRQKAKIEKLAKFNDILLEAVQGWQKRYETLVKEFTEGEKK